MNKLLSLAVLLLAQAVCFGQSLKFDPNGNGIWGLPGALDRRTVVRTNLFVSNAAAGILDIYTTPASTKTFLPSASFMGTTNATGGSTTIYVKTNSVYYRNSIATAIATNTLTSFVSTGILLYAGETLSVSNASVGANYFVSLLEIPSTYRFVGPRMALTGGNDTLYTCPAGYMLGKPIADQLNANTSSFASVANTSGAAVTVSMFIVPSGDSPTGNNRLVTSSINNNANSTFNIPLLFEGQSVVFLSSSSAADQNVTLFMAFEYPIP